ncbi:MAG TPA: hypothetical protein VLU46_07705 [Thermoanaerobaculia bacterium]|nr:hypothetical protein [Thermoanaerobaculia bacterium]
MARTMTLHFRSGQSQRFSDLGRGDLDVLREVWCSVALQRDERRAEARRYTRGSGQRGSQVCPSCRSPMKRRDKALRLSWARPGGGYAYLGFPQMTTIAARSSTS